MRASLRLDLTGRPRLRLGGMPTVLRVAWLALALTSPPGCGHHSPPATVEGTLRRDGQPLDNCLVTFLPEPEQETPGPHSTGLTDPRGLYRPRFDNQQEAVATGWHRVTVQDLSVSTGIRRRDHGTVDAEAEETAPPPPVRRSRVPESYTSWTETPLRKEVKPGHQVIDLEIKD